ncbi:MAG: hypothetical protein HY092_02560 [Candidatus Kerfeldbacteria bacterium]|nr:hypothetical protein [Candidatus Kerfeldbacteria bacterium]
MDKKPTSVNLTRLWLWPFILGGIPFIYLFAAALQKAIRYFQPRYFFPGLSWNFDVIGTFVVVFFPLLFILTTVKAYSKTPTTNQPQTMFLIKVFLIMAGALILMNVEKTQWEFWWVVIIVSILLLLRLHPRLKKVVGWLGLVALVAYALQIVVRAGHR